jgi:hypothetical protein
VKRYRVTGIPISPPFSALAGRRVGDEFEADVDPDIEQLLTGAGALLILPNKPVAHKRAAPVAKEEPAAAPPSAATTKETPAPAKPETVERSAATSSTAGVAGKPQRRRGG